MSTPSRIGAYVANFVPDNSGRTITQAYQVISATSGTVNLIPTAQDNFFNFTTALAGNMTINVGVTYSTLSNTGAVTTGYNALICDNITIMLNGGASPFVLTYGSNIMGSGATLSVAASKPTIVKGIFNGTEYICSTITANS